MKMNIKGRTYTIRKSKEPLVNEGQVCDGICNVETKEIWIMDDLSKRLSDIVIKHEIIHALFYECGLRDYYTDEKLVDWIAMNVPQIDTDFKYIMTGLKYGKHKKTIKR